MKLFSFIKWKWRQTTASDYCYWIGLIFIGVGFLSLYPYSKYLIGIGLIVWLVAMVKFLIVEQLKREYNTFLKERKDLFSTIKNSE